MKHTKQEFSDFLRWFTDSSKEYCNDMAEQYLKTININNMENVNLTNKQPQNPQFNIGAGSGSLPSDNRIVAEAIQAARKVDTEVGLLPSNNDIRIFCLGAKWMRDLAQGNDR